MTDIEKIKDIQAQIKSLKKDYYKPEDKGIRDALSRAEYALNSAKKIIFDRVPIDGQMSLFDYIEDEMER